MKHLREILDSMTLAELEAITRRYAEKKLDDIDGRERKMIFNNKEEQEEHVTALAENAHRLLFHFINDGIYAIDNKDIGK